MEVSRKERWRGRHVFVTGATGLVGSWLCQRLVDYGTHVVALVMDHDPQSPLFRQGLAERIHIVSGKLQDYRTLERGLAAHDIETVFHLGAQALVGVGFRAPLDTFESNIRGTYMLLEAARQVGGNVLKRVVVASSDKAYGDSDILPYTEDMPVRGRNPYDVSKSCTDLIAFTYAHSYRLPVTVARCGNIFGGRDLNWSRIVPGTIRSLLAGEQPVLRSDGKLVRDYIFVEDIVDAYLTLAEAPDEAVQGEAFNFSLDSKVDVLDIVGRIARLMGRDDLPPRILDQASGEIQNQFLCSQKAKDRLGWTARFGLEAGLEQTIDWYRGYLGHGQ